MADKADKKPDFKLLVPYVPITLLDWYAETAPHTTHVVSKHTGVVACIDASGFTALTRRLAQFGKEGPELLTSLLNRFFEAMSTEILPYGGDILKFAGDALWVYFPVAPNLTRLSGRLHRALERVNSDSDLTADSPLGIHIGAEFGEFYLASLGDPSHRLEAEPVGELFRTVFKACDLAVTGELVIGPRLAVQCRDDISLTARDEHYFVVGMTPGAEATVTTESLSATGTPAGDLSFLTPYVATDVLERMRTSDEVSQFSSEHREVAVLFANFEYERPEDSDDHLLTIVELSGIIGETFNLIRLMGGSIARIDPYQGGHKLLVLFGAPVKREGEEIRAVKCATSLTALDHPGFKIRAGLAFGSLFCGDVGTERRKEYTVMGDAINMAARLMSKSGWNEILIDTKLRDRLPAEIVTTPRTFALKGVGSDVICHSFVNIAESAGHNGAVGAVVGQISEFEMLAAAMEDARGGVRGIANVFGETGVGKSTLIERFVNEVCSDKTVRIFCKNSVLFGHGWLARKLMFRLASREDKATPQQVFALVRQAIGEQWLPLMTDLLEIDVPENSWTQGLTPELRAQKSREIYSRIVEHLVDSFRIVVIEDFDRADEYSRLLVSSLAETSTPSPLFLIVSSLDAEFSDGSQSAGVTNLKMENPKAEDWWRFFDGTFENGKRERELFERVLRASDGNPYYITEFIRRYTDKGTLVSNQLSGKLELLATEVDLPVPTGLGELQLAKFDSLRESDRRLLKIAGVVGRAFSVKLIAELLSDDKETEIADRLNELCRSGLLTYDAEKARFDFKHASMREVVYSCLAESEARTLHRHLAEILARDTATSQPALLAFHNFRAQNWSKAFGYSLEAAVSASRVNSLTEAAELFERCQKVIDLAGLQALGPEPLYRFYQHNNRFLAVGAEVVKSYRLCRTWRRYAKTHGEASECHKAAIETARMLFRQSKYYRSRLILQRVMASAEKTGDLRSVALALSHIAETYRRAGEFAEAQNQSRKAVDLAAGLNDRQMLADAMNILGLALWGGGKLVEAAQNYHKSLELGRDFNNLSGASTQTNLSIIEQELGHFAEAERLLMQAIDALHNAGDRQNEAYASGNLANLCRISGKLVRTEQLYRQADLVFLRLDDTHAHHYVIGNIGDIELMLNRLREATEKFTTVIEFARSVDDKELVAECEIRFGELAFFQRNTAEAEKRYRSGLELAESIGSTEYCIRACIGLARLYIGERNHEAAVELIQKVTEAAAANNAVLAKMEAVFLLGENHRIRAEFHEASTCYRETLDYARSQNVFELILKSAVRLYETDAKARDEVSSVLRKLAAQFVAENNEQLWNEVINSAYFSYFAATLKAVIRQSDRSLSPTV